MADVRELVTRILFKLDKNSVRNAEKATDNIKKKLKTAASRGKGSRWLFFLPEKVFSLPKQRPHNKQRHKTPTTAF